MISKYVVEEESKVSIHFLICVVIRDKLSEEQRDLVDITPDDIDRIAKIIWPKSYLCAAAANLFALDLQSALQQQFPELVELSPDRSMNEGKFRLWCSEQVNRFGEWLEIKPVE